jgi:hypothetical protein
MRRLAVATVVAFAGCFGEDEGGNPPAISDGSSGEGTSASAGTFTGGEASAGTTGATTTDGSTSTDATATDGSASATETSASTTDATASTGAEGSACPPCMPGTVCCEEPLPCAGDCVPDCNVGGCPPDLVCDPSGVCMPGGGTSESTSAVSVGESSDSASVGESSDDAGTTGMALPCDPSPCENGGTCLEDGLGGFTCACVGVWTGPTCAQATGTLPDVLANCPDETFLDVSLWPGPGGGYPDPELDIVCNANTMTVTSNNMTHYEFVQVSPFDLVEQMQVFQIPLMTLWNDPPLEASVLGEVGIAINGLVLGTPSASAMLEYADPAATEVTDACDGHTNAQGYHYHSLVPTCFHPGDDGTARSPIIGWIFDGYPMYGPYECTDETCTTVVEMQSSWAEINDPADCAWQSYAYIGDADEESDGDDVLDRCNGHIGPYGDYHYHMTNAYPWTTRCYRGDPSMDGQLYGTMADMQFEANCVDGVYVGP